MQWFSDSAPDADDGNTDSNVRLEIDAVSTRCTAVSSVLDSAFRQLQFICLDLPALSGWEHSDNSFCLSPAASSNQVDFVKTMTNIEMHLVHLFSDFCRIRSYDAPLPISSTSSSNILKEFVVVQVKSCGLIRLCPILRSTPLICKL